MCGPPSVHPFPGYWEGRERVCGPPSAHPFPGYWDGRERVCGPPSVHPFPGYWEDNLNCETWAGDREARAVSEECKQLGGIP